MSDTKYAAIAGMTNEKIIWAIDQYGRNRPPGWEKDSWPRALLDEKERRLRTQLGNIVFQHHA